MLLTYGSAKTHAHSTFGHRQSQTLKHGCRNSGRSQALLSHMCQALGLAKRIHRGDTSRNFYALPAVVQKQDAIGWQSFLEGRPSVGWSEVQHRYYEFLDSRRTGLRWLTALIQKLWDVAWDMWDHRNRVLHDQNIRSHATYRFNRLQMSSPQVQSV
jgi:hypothetical protein